MAFAIECILAFRKARRLESASVELSVAVLSEFCSSTDLGWWESTALDRIWPLIEKRTIAAETGSNSLQDAIEWAFNDIGRGNLYSAVVGHSETTLSGALKVAAALAARDVALPDASRFSQHSFLDAGGWGSPIAIQL